MTARKVIQPKTTAETRLEPFDFSSFLGAGETISTAVATAAVWSGTDAAPSGVINGVASISGTVATQSLTAGVAGVIYAIIMTITTNLAQTLQISGFLTVTPTAP